MDDRIFDILEQVPPRCLAAFSTSLKAKGTKGHMRAAAFEIGCDRCQGALFSVRLLERSWSNGENKSQIGLIAVCAECGHRAVLFDSTRHGYDGENGHLQFMSGPDEEAPLDGPSSPTRVRLEFIYNIDWDELQEMAEEGGRSPRDYFDWLHLLRAPPGGDDWTYDWECECA